MLELDLWHSKLAVLVCRRLQVAHICIRVFRFFLSGKWRSRSRSKSKQPHHLSTAKIYSSDWPTITIPFFCSTYASGKKTSKGKQETILLYDHLSGCELISASDAYWLLTKVWKYEYFLVNGHFSLVIINLQCLDVSQCILVFCCPTWKGWGFMLFHSFAIGYGP